MHWEVALNNEPGEMTCRNKSKIMLRLIHITLTDVGKASQKSGEVEFGEIRCICRNIGLNESGQMKNAIQL